MRGAMAHRSNRFWSIGYALLVCALALRLIVAPGFMPVFGGSGISIGMCSGNGAVALPGKSDAPPHADKSCAFAALAMAAPPVADIVLPAPARRLGNATLSSPMADRPHLGSPAPPPPATGPPLLA